MFFLCVSIFIATHGYKQGRIYFVVASSNTNNLYKQFAVVPYHCEIFKFWKTVSATGWIRPCFLTKYCHLRSRRDGIVNVRMRAYKR